MKYFNRNSKRKPRRRDVILMFKAVFDDSVKTRRNKQEATFSMLNSFEGIRVFTWPDGVDGRVGDVAEIPLAGTMNEAVEYLCDKPGEFRPVFLPFDIAKQNFPHLSWADMTIDGLCLEENKK